MQINRIAILVFPGVEELDFVGVYEVLAKLKQIKDDSPEVRIIGTAEEITCALGLKVIPHELYQGFVGYDLISAALDLGLKIVELACGREVSGQLAERIEYWRNPLPTVGAALVRQGKILLVRQTYGRHAGRWTFPNGFVGHEETIYTAAKRELKEEAGVEGEVKGLILVSSSATGNNIWLLTLLDWTSGEPVPDMVETDAAKFFSLEEIQSTEEMSDLRKQIAYKILKGEIHLLPLDAALVTKLNRNLHQYAIYL